MINHLFGDVMSSGSQLKDLYFAFRPRGEPNTTTLYRFNLTYGRFQDIGEKLTPKYNQQVLIFFLHTDLDKIFEIVHAGGNIVAYLLFCASNKKFSFATQTDDFLVYI